MRLARLFPGMPETARIEALADQMLVPDRVAGEVAYLDRPMIGGVERPYGWAWLLALHEELGLRPDRPWASALAPLARAFAARFSAYLPQLTYPVRSGKHDNTAFALIHALRWATRHDPALATLIEDRANASFAADRDCRPWEPSGEDFLSPTLCEAVLMQDVLGEDFAAWLSDFLPDPFGAASACLRSPAQVSNRRDGRLAHLDGLNLSRAWCWQMLAEALSDPAAAHTVAEAHLAAALPHLADDYMGEHWLATFALLVFSDQGSGIRDQGSGIRDQGSGIRDQGSEEPLTSDF
jgi:hypothetical protein